MLKNNVASMKKKLLLIFIMVILPNKFIYSSQDVHIHGQSTAKIIIADSTIKMTVKIPALSVVGFEHSPKSTAEKELVALKKEDLEESILFNFYSKKKWFRSKKNSHA